jgi:hypothetical protein
MILALGERRRPADRPRKLRRDYARQLDASERLTTSNFKTGHVHDEFVDLADRVHDAERAYRPHHRGVREPLATIVDGTRPHRATTTQEELLRLALPSRVALGNLVNRSTSWQQARTCILTWATRRATRRVTVNSLVAKVVSQTETAHDSLSLQMSAFDDL